MHARKDAVDILPMGGQLQHAHDINAHAFTGLDLTGAAAMRAVLVDAALERGTNALASHFDQPKLGDLENLRACPITFDGIAQRPLDFTAVAVLAHVDEVIDDDA